ncbi:hypothetical protein K2173_016859 [Erythroxylum novogranatense]|uniref:Uncharacterized protein n=1 Tax=Erythroxylum novogranatense TaxID=1862640 RepID=A0AAV8SHY6_9ROSI|nr:hypothetical protein K2173_016859 [Erythroxylum novogranatense]
MRRDSSNIPQLEPLKIKQDATKVCSKPLMTGHASTPNFSAEDDHGGATVSVPFIWESQPGTPKVKFRENSSLPPLTPPPSYFCNTPKGTTSAKKLSKPYNLLTTIFSKRATKRASLQVSPSSLLSSSSSWSPSFSTSSSNSTSMDTEYREPYGTLSPRKSSVSRMTADEEHRCSESPVSILCFGIGRGANARSKCRYPSMIKVLFKDYY